MTTYKPLDVEKVVFDKLWKIANPQGEFELGGQPAVDFFLRAEITIETLRHIWALSTPLATMTLGNFYTALRYITFCQQGIPTLDEGQRNIHLLI
jgi:hypothetical protein